MRTGLDASMLTPGSTPPDESLTTPESDAWAKAAAGTATRNANTVSTRFKRVMFPSLELPRRRICGLHPSAFPRCGYALRRLDQLGRVSGPPGTRRALVPFRERNPVEAIPQHVGAGWPVRGALGEAVEDERVELLGNRLLRQLRR